MFDTYKVVTEWAGRSLILETGKIARQADGAVLATYGETIVLATVVSDKASKLEQDFFPLVVHYQEKTYSAGKIPGGYFKREGRPSDNEILVSRLIDRSIRPLFPKGYKSDTQIIITVMQHDLENNPDILSIIAASAALTISGIPFMGPICGARIGYIDEKYIMNPGIESINNSKLDLVISGTLESVLMVESESKELEENILLGAISFGMENFQPVINAIIRLSEETAKEPRHFEKEDQSEIEKIIFDKAGEDLSSAYYIADKKKRYSLIESILNNLKNTLLSQESTLLKVSEEKICEVFQNIQSKIMRRNIIDTGIRIDGRKLDEIRSIDAQVGIFPRTHGSALFTRGETQAIVIVTLGTSEDEQYIDMLTGLTKEKFMLHYNFPPFSVGETGRLSSPNRREIGHGKLAWRAIRQTLPSKEDFPYTIRVVSEITESNGSSSMATICGTSLALMDAGVPMKSPISGIAMGLIKEQNNFFILSDILGDEDHLGDMDFKVAGTRQGITALQMDIKIHGIKKEIMEVALEKAKEGRIYILEKMEKEISTARSTLKNHVPKIELINIPKEKIRDVIGSGGKIIREIVEKTGTKISIEDTGTVKISSSDLKKIESAKKWITSIVSEPKIGIIYQGTVVKTVDFGAFVNFFGSRDGLVHISQLSESHVSKTTDVIKKGDRVWVKLIGFDERGKVRLSMKNINQKTGGKILP